MSYLILNDYWCVHAKYNYLSALPKNFQFDEILNGQIGIAYSGEDAISPARSIKEFLKENKIV